MKRLHNSTPILTNTWNLSHLKLVVLVRAMKQHILFTMLFDFSLEFIKTCNFLFIHRKKHIYETVLLAEHGSGYQKAARKHKKLHVRRLKSIGKISILIEMMCVCCAHVGMKWLEHLWVHFVVCVMACLCWADICCNALVGNQLSNSSVKKQIWPEVLSHIRDL